MTRQHLSDIRIAAIILGIVLPVIGGVLCGVHF